MPPGVAVGTPMTIADVIAKTAVMFVLVAFVVPLFWTSMKELATADATQMLVASVNRGEALSTDRMMIYADSAREVRELADLRVIQPGIKR